MKEEIKKEDKSKIAMEELNLNIKHQKIKTKDYLQVGYKFDDGLYVFIKTIPNSFELKKTMEKIK